MKMKIEFVVFWISTQPKLHSDDSYYVLGERMAAFDTEDKAIDYIDSLMLKSRNMCTILKVYSGAND